VKERRRHMFTFLHSADVHLDSPLRGLERYPGAPVEDIRSATRRAFDQLITRAEDDRVDLLLLAGDIYDGDWRDFNTGLYFAQGMQRLARAGIRVCLISGNHDADSHISRRLRLPDNVAVFSTRAPETRTFDDLGCAVHGQGFATRAVTDNLALHYPEPVSGLFNIGLLHTALEGRAGHDTYAPCSVADLSGRGYDYWALGHVHQREVVHRDPWIVFSGCLQGRHIREPGAHGCTHVTVDDSGDVSVQALALDVFRWHGVTVDIAALGSVDEVLAAVDVELRACHEQADNRPGAVRVVLQGRSRLHTTLQRELDSLSSECRSLANALHAPAFWLQKVVLQTQPLARMDATLHDAAVTDMRAYIDELLADPERTQALIEAEAGSLLQKLPAEIRRDALADVLEPEGAAELLRDSGDYLLSLLGTEDGA